MRCGDGVDDDTDGLTDCADPDCWWDTQCSGCEGAGESDALGKEDDAICATRERCEELCDLVGCGSIDMHRSLPRCYLNEGTAMCGPVKTGPAGGTYSVLEKRELAKAAYTTVTGEVSCDETPLAFGTVAKQLGFGPGVCGHKLCRPRADCEDVCSALGNCTAIKVEPEGNVRACTFFMACTPNYFSPRMHTLS